MGSVTYGEEWSVSQRKGHLIALDEPSEAESCAAPSVRGTTADSALLAEEKMPSNICIR